MIFYCEFAVSTSKISSEYNVILMVIHLFFQYYAILNNTQMTQRILEKDFRFVSMTIPRYLIEFTSFILQLNRSMLILLNWDLLAKVSETAM